MGVRIKHFCQPTLQASRTAASFSAGRMSSDKKLETPEELLSLYNDLDRLRKYKYFQPVVTNINNEGFYMDLPYEEIKKIVEDCRDKFLAAVPQLERSGLRWEHIGSTSIKGMPGTKFPDALLIVPEFPPSEGVIQAFLDCGYYFHGSSALDVRDLWWMLVFTDGILKDHKLTVHVVTEENAAGKILLETRDMCRNEEWAFQDYKEAKVSAYEAGKGKKSKLLEMLRQKHSAAMNN